MWDNYNYCQDSFYHQYVRQHAAMMHWIQSLHSMANIQHENNTTCHANIQYPEPVCYNNLAKEYHSSTQSTTLSESSSDTEEKEESYEEDESDCEYELNVEAILAMRRAKEELKKEESSDSSSIVMIEKAEEFEFVEFGSKQEIESKRSIMAGGLRDRNAEFQYERQYKKHLYGEKFTTIAGLETAMSLTYERLCDNHQPPVWPVYPLRLSSSA